MERDQEILVSLFKNKVLTLKQVHQAFFKGSKVQAASYRLGKLQSENFIGKKALQINRRCEVYFFITKKGIEAIQEELAGEVAKVGYKSDSLFHDLNLTALSLKLERYSIVNQVYYESELQSFTQSALSENLLPFVHLRSDRVVEVKAQGKTVLIPLEYERTLKLKSRIKAKLTEYYKYDNVLAAMYVCGNESMVNSIMKIDEDISYNTNSKLYFATLKDVLSEDKKVTFSNCNNEKLYIY